MNFPSLTSGFKTRSIIKAWRKISAREMAKPDDKAAPQLETPNNVIVKPHIAAEISTKSAIVATAFPKRGKMNKSPIIYERPVTSKLIQIKFVIVAGSNIDRIDRITIE